MHKYAVQKIFDKLYEKGEIYKGNYKGWYCLPCEALFTDAPTFIIHRFEVKDAILRTLNMLQKK